MIPAAILYGLENGVAKELARADQFADGYGMMLIIIATIRELIGSGKLFGYTIFQTVQDGGWYQTNGLFLLAPSAFFIIGLWVRVNETPEVWRIGFLTQSSMDFVNLEGMVSVYLPHSYAISGWVIVTSAENVKPAEGFTAQKAMEFALSGGITTIKKG